MTKLNIAVIGSGISGLSAAWLLSKNHAVTVYEKKQKFGGHSNTIIVDSGAEKIPVDTGFIVYNSDSYPNLIALFNKLEVATIATSMTFSASFDQGDYEYSGSGFYGLFGQWSNLLNANHWRMIYDISRFLSRARQDDPDTLPLELSLGDYLDRGRYGKSFIHKHILPMGAAIWSAPCEVILNFPAASFIRFFANHGLLQIRNRPLWRTVKGGSQNYVNRLIGDTYGECHTERQVKHIWRHIGGVHIEDTSGTLTSFDHVVIATHADQAINILADADEAELQLLGAFSYSQNEAVLHTDYSFMPKRKRLWSSWNYLAESRQPGSTLRTTYWMNHLQSLTAGQNYFITLDPFRSIPDKHKIYSVDYTHPIFDQGALAAQRNLWRIQGQRRTWFCGSYFGYGFHEDGLQSGLAVAESLGGEKRPWSIVGELSRITLRHRNIESNFQEAAE